MVGRFSHAASPPRWDTRLETILADREAVRVLDTGSILRLAQSARQGVSEATVDRWITDAIQDERLVRVVRGLYLNRMVTPTVSLCEAASHLRADAVVSLQRVLGDAGALQIDSTVVTAIVPFSPDRPVPSLGTLHTQGGAFNFRGMPASMLVAGRESDRLVEAAYLRATPEAALLHWLYLSRSPRSTLTTPPLAIAIGQLNTQRLNRLSKTMNLEEPLKQWLTEKHAFDETASVYEQAHVELAPGSP